MKSGRKFLALAMALGLAFTGCGKGTEKNSLNGQRGPLSEEAGQETAEAGSDEAADGLRVHFIDVGQGDSILIQSGEDAMLVDGGTNESGGIVVNYLKSQGIKRLNYLVGTHPHEDHIGGLDDVIRSFEIGTVIMPDTAHTTRTYEDVLDALLEKELSVTLPVPGESFGLGDASFTILAPDERIMAEADRTDDLNNMSVGLRLVYGSTAFVMCGDAETLSEEAMVESGIPLQADVLKLGHHGSSTSSSEAFLEAVSPSSAIISCGRDNSYGHPHQETLEKLDRLGIRTYRTDEQGTLVAESDGSRILWSCDTARPGTAGTDEADTSEADISSTDTSDTDVSDTDASAPEGRLYILNRSTKKFHLPDCSSVDSMKEENRISWQGNRKELEDMGYSPCGSCKP